MSISRPTITPMIFGSNNTSKSNVLADAEWASLAPKVFQKHFDRGHTKESCLIIESIAL